MLVHDVLIPAAPGLGVDHVLRHIVVNRRDGLLLLDQDALGFGKHVVALFTRGHPCGLLDQLIVAIVREATAVHGAARYEHVQEGVRVAIVADPTRPRNVELRGTAAGQIGLPLLVLEGNLNIEVLQPLLLDVLGNLLVRLIGVVEDAQLGETLTVGIAGFGKQFLGALYVHGVPFNAGIAFHVGNHGVGGNLAGLSNNLGDLGTIEAHG